VEYNGELYNDNPDPVWVHDPGCDRGHVGRDLGSDPGTDPSVALVEMPYSQLATKYGISESTVKRCVRQLKLEHGGKFGTQVVGRPTQFSPTEVNLLELTLLTKSDPSKDIEGLDHEDEVEDILDISYEERDSFEDLVPTSAIVLRQKDYGTEAERIEQANQAVDEDWQDVLLLLENEATELVNEHTVEMAKLKVVLKQHLVATAKNALQAGKPILKKKKPRDS
jgi:transposase